MTPTTPHKRKLVLQVYLWQGLHSGALRDLYLDASQRELKLRLVRGGCVRPGLSLRNSLHTMLAVCEACA